MIGRKAPEASPSVTNCFTAASLSSRAIVEGRLKPRIVKSFHKVCAIGRL
jgi:hypothetical protein